MNQTWLDQLVAIGAKPENFVGNTVVSHPSVIQVTDRSETVVVRITGEDAQTFLQSQMCNDQNKVTAASGQLSGYCSPKGRLLALPTVVASENNNEFYWLLPEDVVETVVKRLKMFVLRAQVSIEVAQDWVVMGIIAPSTKVPENTQNWLGSDNADAMASWTVNGHPAIKLHSGADQTRTTLFGPSDAVATSLQQLIDQLDASETLWQWASKEAWALSDVLAGVPSVVARNQDAFVPQMMNMEQVDGLSFKKGCYPGQEIVARMQYLGKLKRHMIRLSSPSTAAPFPGDTLTAGEDTSAGVVVTSVVTDQGMTCLAVVKTSVDASDFVWDESPMTPEALPYSD